MRLALTPRKTLLLATAGIIAAGVRLNPPRLHAQSSAGQASNTAFEVASVKPNKLAEGVVGINFEAGGRFTAANETLRQLIAVAYSTSGPPLSDSQISGGPNWIASDRFDIVAKGDVDTPSVGPAVVDQVRLMLRALLAERFKLTVHHENRELPIYALVVARSDGKLGLQLHVAEGDCATGIAARGNGPAAPGGPFCGIRGGPGRLMLSYVTMPALATTLSRAVNRTVVDRTGLGGSFNGNLEWTPDQTPAPSPGGVPPGALPPPPSDGPSIFSALQEQLGLKLNSQKGPVDVLAIDRVDHPTED